MDSDTAMDTAKESIQPLRLGNRQRRLEAIKKRREVLESKIRQYEDSIDAYDGHDPLSVWWDYICWTEAYPKTLNEWSLYENTVLKCMVLFEHDTRYRQDRRMINLYTKYIDTQDDPNYFYNTLYERGIGTTVADFYISWSFYQDAMNNFEQVEEIFRKGFNAGAQPMLDLVHAHEDFRISKTKRMLYDDEGSKKQFLATMVEKRSVMTSLGPHEKKYVRSIQTGIAVNKLAVYVQDRNTGAIRKSLVKRKIEEDDEEKAVDVIHPPKRDFVRETMPLSASSPQHFTSPPFRPATAPAPELSTFMETSPKLDKKLLAVVKGIGHPDRLVSHASLNEISDILESPEKQAVLRDYDEIYIESVLEQFKHLSQRPVSEAVILYQPLLSSLFNFFNSKTLGDKLGVTTIKNLIAVLLGLMSDHKFGAGEEYTKVINSICLKILDRCNFTNLNCALVQLLRETCSASALPKFTELLMKCIWRNVKLMPERVNELNYEALLMEIHDFMLALPTKCWAQRPSDTPMRTIKTIIHNMTKIKGTGILQHLNNIPKHSELNTYVLRVLKVKLKLLNS